MKKLLKIVGIIALAFFPVTFLIYFFNLDMKAAALLIRPLTFWYDKSRDYREKKKRRVTS